MKRASIAVLALAGWLGLGVGVAESRPVLAGWLERAILTPGGAGLIAMLDTGAWDSSLKVIRWRLIRGGGHGRESVKFLFKDARGRLITMIRLTAGLKKQRALDGSTVRQYFVRLGVCIGRVYRETKVLLTPYRNSDYTLVLGRRFMGSNFMVDSGLTYQLRPMCRAVAGSTFTPGYRPPPPPTPRQRPHLTRRCPPKYIYHPMIKKCIPPAYARRPCPRGTVWYPRWNVCGPRRGAAARRCPAGQFYYAPLRRCLQRPAQGQRRCPAGQRWAPRLKRCVPLQSGQRRCPAGQFWHRLVKRCIPRAYGRRPCPQGTMWYPKWRVCGPRRGAAARRCPLGQRWAPRLKRCVPLRPGQLSQQPAGNVGAYNQQGLTPLHLAVKAGRLRMVQILIKRGANVNAPARLRGAAGGSTPLHFAVYYSKARIAQVLINRGANVNAMTMSGSTPLHVAAFYGRPQIAMMLLRRRANVNARDRRNLTPLRVAMMRRKARMVRLLRSRGGRL